uniref:Multiple sugar transport system permease protein n=1 Tax=Candidatus Kentrum sp. SD TaxID=2126332 RepID=A0A450YEH1_9GAMM|nr:MAG: multiple sugar transport system permease protein [Candidatus Kentron sp. SD]VFK45374.1 MAG: multiple sugar transport system permease protein [Candidatus Kentron sp. SD]VFK79534.1 MAG: multiple sugar transport system permease protein [Candidatus Kentron sp. SD]
MSLNRVLAWVLLLALGGMVLIPFGATLWKSLLSLDPALPGRYGAFVGLDNYLALLRDEPDFYTSLNTTLRFVGVAGVQCLLALAGALWLRFLWPKRLPVSLILLLILPLVVAPTLVGLMGRFYLHDQIGPITRLLHDLGVLALDQAPLGDASGAWIWISALDAWHWLPFTMLLFYYSFSVVPQRHHDMAAIDRLGYRETALKIVWPQVWGLVVIISLLRLLEAFRAYDIAQVLTGGGPGTSTLFVSLYANRITFAQQRFGLGAAHLVLMEASAYALIFLLIGRAQAFRRLLRGHTQ